MADFTPNRPRAYSNPNKRAIRQLLAAEACEPMARRMAAEHPDRVVTLLRDALLCCGHADARGR